MTTLGFLASATGDPSLVKYRVAPQANEGVPASEADFTDFYGYGGSLALESATIERQALPGASISPLLPLIGKLNLPDASFRIGDADPVNKMLMVALANLFRKYTNTDNATWRRWLFSPGAATAASTWFTLLEDNDVLPRTRFVDCIVKSLVASAAPGENFSVLTSFVRGMFDFHGAVTQTAGTGSTLPVFRKFWEGQLTADATDKDLYLKILDASAKTYLGKVAAASAYSADDDVYVLGEWMRFYNELADRIDRRVGSIEEQIEFYEPVGATLVTGDIFKVAKLRAAWSPSYPTPRPISSVQTQFVIRKDGTDRTIRVEGGWNISHEAPGVVRREDTGGRQSARTRRAGVLKIVLTPTRELGDLDFQRLLLTAEKIAIVIDSEIPVEISTSGRPYRILQMYPSVRGEGPGFGVAEGAANRDEPVRFVAGIPESEFTYDGIATSEAACWVLENDIATL